MIHSTVVGLVLGVGLLLLDAFAEAALEAIFGYIGASAIWLISFGRVRIEPRGRGESALAYWLGIALVLLLAFGLCTFLNR